MSASAMIPIVFCASFVPCVNATKLPGEDLPAAEEAIHAARRAPPDDPDDHDHQREGDREADHRRQDARDDDLLPDAVPVDDVEPDAAIADPATPPISAWLELDGSPRNQVTRFQRDRADEAGEDDAQRHRVRVHDSRRDRRRDFSETNAPAKLRIGRDEDGRARRECPRRDARRDRVRGVVEAVREVEEEGDDDDGSEGEVLHASRPSS